MLVCSCVSSFFLFLFLSSMDCGVLYTCTCTRVKAGSQYNASAAYRHLPSTDGGIDQSSIPPSVMVDDSTKQNAALALYCEPA